MRMDETQSDLVCLLYRANTLGLKGVCHGIKDTG